MSDGRLSVKIDGAITVPVALAGVPAGTYAASVKSSVALEGGLVIKAAHGVLEQLRVVIDSSQGTGRYWIQLFDAVSEPVDGTAVSATLPLIYPINFVTGTDTTINVPLPERGVFFATGIYVCVSTTAFTKTRVAGRCTFSGGYA